MYVTPHTFKLGFLSEENSRKMLQNLHYFLGKKEKTQIIVMKRLAIFSLLSAKTSTIAKEIVHREGALELTYIYYTRSWWSSPKVPL